MIPARDKNGSRIRKGDEVEFTLKGIVTRVFPNQAVPTIVVKGAVVIASDVKIVVPVDVEDDVEDDSWQSLNNPEPVL